MTLPDVSAQEVVTIHIIEKDLGHVSVPHHKTTVGAPRGTDAVPRRPRGTIIIIATNGIVTTVGIAAAVGTIDITAHQDITTIDTIPLPTDIIIITMAVTITIIVKNIMTSLLAVEENPELSISFYINTIHLTILNLQSNVNIFHNSAVMYIIFYVELI